MTDVFPPAHRMLVSTQVRLEFYAVTTYELTRLTTPSRASRAGEEITGRQQRGDP